MAGWSLNATQPLMAERPALCPAPASTLGTVAGLHLPACLDGRARLACIIVPPPFPIFEGGLT